MFIPPKKQIIKKKTISKITGRNMKHSVSFASTTTNSSKKSILNHQNIHPMVKSLQLLKKYKNSLFFIMRITSMTLT